MEGWQSYKLNRGIRHCRAAARPDARPKVSP
jgi:hypothetical protein